MQSRRKDSAGAREGGDTEDTPDNPDSAHYNNNKPHDEPQDKDKDQDRDREHTLPVEAETVAKDKPRKKLLSLEGAFYAAHLLFAFGYVCVFVCIHVCI